MNKKHGIRGIFFLLLLVAVVASACGTIEIDALPAAASEQPADETADIAASEASVEDATPAGDAEVVLAEETAPTTPLAAANSSTGAAGGVEQVSLPGCYDFDNGITLAPPDPACDFNLLPGPDSDTIEIYPIGSAQQAYGAVFPEAPVLDQCAENSAFSAEPELVAPLAAQ